MSERKIVERVVQRYASSTLKWKKYPGSVAKMTQTGMGPYSKTEDGRFMIYVSRYLQGQPGNRSYVYHFSAVDYGIPSGGYRFTNIPIFQGGSGFKTEHSTNVKTVFAAVEKWAQEHPLTGDGA